MPSQKPRLALTLSVELRATLEELANVEAKPASKVVTDLLQELLPQLQGLVRLRRAAKQGNQLAARNALRDMVGETVAELMTRTQPELFPAKKKKRATAP